MAGDQLGWGLWVEGGIALCIPTLIISSKVVLYLSQVEDEKVK